MKLADAVETGRVRPAARGALVRWLFLLPAAGFLALFYFYPLATIGQVSVARAAGGLGAVLAQVAGSASLRGVFAFTLWQAALSTAATLAVGVPGAYLLARYRFGGQGLLRALTAVPFVLPTLVVAAAFNALLGPRGWVNVALMAALNLSAPPITFVNTFGAILLAHVFYNTTIVLRLVGDFWSRLDPRLVAAARALGASPARAFREVTLPLLAPALGAAALLVFIFDFTSFGVVLVLGGPRFATLETEIYRQTIYLFNLPVAAVLALIQLLCTLGLSLVYARLSARATAPLNLRAARDTRQPLRTARMRLAAGLLVGGLIALLVLPLAALAVRSVVRLDAERGQSGPVQRGFTLAYYQELSQNRRNNLFYVPPTAAIGNSLAAAAATVVLALALGLPAAWAVAGRSEAGRGVHAAGLALDALLLLPLGTSAVTLGLGFIVALDTPPLDLRASPVLLPLAHTLVALPFVVRSLVPALRSIRPRLRQAAAVLGANPAQVWREVDLPLVGRAVIVAATFAFTLSLGEFGATAIIARPEHPTVPVVIYRLLGLPGALNYGQALALSTILMLVCTAGILAIERLRVGEVGEF
jgi:thiamine transport system permease protein